MSDTLLVGAQVDAVRKAAYQEVAKQSGKSFSDWLRDVADKEVAEIFAAGGRTYDPPPVRKRGRQAGTPQALNSVAQHARSSLTASQSTRKRSAGKTRRPPVRESGVQPA